MPYLNFGLLSKLPHGVMVLSLFRWDLLPILEGEDVG